MPAACGRCRDGASRQRPCRQITTVVRSGLRGGSRFRPAGGTSTRREPRSRTRNVPRRLDSPSRFSRDSGRSPRRWIPLAAGLFRRTGGTSDTAWCCASISGSARSVPGAGGEGRCARSRSRVACGRPGSGEPCRRSVDLHGPCSQGQGHGVRPQCGTVLFSHCLGIGLSRGPVHQASPDAVRSPGLRPGPHHHPQRKSCVRFPDGDHLRDPRGGHDLGRVRRIPSFPVDTRRRHRMAAPSFRGPGSVVRILLLDVGTRSDQPAAHRKHSPLSVGRQSSFTAQLNRHSLATVLATRYRASALLINSGWRSIRRWNLACSGSASNEGFSLFRGLPSRIWTCMR